MAKTKYFGHTGADDYRIKSFLIHADDYIIIEFLKQTVPAVYHNFIQVEKNLNKIVLLHNEL